MAKKSTKKFAAKGQLKKTIQRRHKHQEIKKRVQSRKAGKGTGKKVDANAQDLDSTVKGDVTTVDEILGADFMENWRRDDDEEEEEEEEEEKGDIGDEVGEEGEDEEDEEEDVSDVRSFASVDDLEDEGEAHLIELSKLAEKDPEFYKYLQENDRELLEFDPTAIPDTGDDEMFGVDDKGGVEVGTTPVLTRDALKQWQKALLEHRSLKSLRKLLIAFRSAVHMNEENQDVAWRIDNSSVYNKLITTALKYTPVVLEHHVPYKSFQNGKFKPPTQSPKLNTLQKLIQSYFHNTIHLLDQLTDTEMIELVVKESAKIIPWVISSRRAVKLYLKKCLELWSTAEDSIRIASFLAIKKLASANDTSIMDQVLKGLYLTLVRSCKSTSSHTLPSITLMKNSASEIFCIDHATAYQHAFGYIRQLAIHLRESMKVKTKEAYKQVYNWQFVHSIDFWCTVLSQAHGKGQEGQESELTLMVYPLVQVSLGAIRIISNSRSFPLHLHILRSLLHLTRNTRIYIPLASYILPIISTTLASSRPKPSTLRPLDFDIVIRAPQQYMKTRVYGEGLLEETSFVLVEWLSSQTVQGSIAFPEIVVGIIVMLRRTLKAATKAGARGKEIDAIKGLVERIEDSAKWVEGKRQGVAFGPEKFKAVQDWEDAMREKVEESPLGRYAKIVRKARERRKALVEKARDGEAEILEELSS